MGFPSVSDPPPYQASDAYGVEVVPTLFVVDGSGTIVETVESWDRAGYNRDQSHCVRSCIAVVPAQTVQPPAVVSGSSQSWVSYSYSPSPPAGRRSTRSGARVS